MTIKMFKSLVLLTIINQLDLLIYVNGISNKSAAIFTDISLQDLPSQYVADVYNITEYEVNCLDKPEAFDRQFLFAIVEYTYKLSYCDVMIKNFLNATTYLISHDFFDCEDRFSDQISSNNITDNISIVSVGTTVLQAYKAINSIIVYFDIKNYAIVYSSIYEKIAQKIFYKLSTQLVVSLNFMLETDDVNLDSSIQNNGLKIDSEYSM